MRCWAGERKNKERKIRHGMSGLFDVAGQLYCHRFEQGKIQEQVLYGFHMYNLN
jgi:hypothetical protein